MKSVITVLLSFTVSGFLVLVLPVPGAAQIQWAEHSIGANVDAACVYASDLDLDGDVDVIGTDWDGGRIIWYENDGDENFTEHIVDNNFDIASSAYSIDIDHDGDIDLAASAMVGDEVAWYENDGSQNFTKHIIDDFFDGARFVDVIDLDCDGDVDVLGTAT